MAFDEDWEDLEPDYFDAAEAQRHLLIVRAFDAPRYYRTQNNPDGMVYPNRQRGQNFEPFPNMVVRCAVADLDADEGPRIYPEAVLFSASLTKVAKLWVGKGPQLLMWKKDGPKQTDPYILRNMRNDEDAVEIGKKFLDEHPEFMELAAPEPYDERPPSQSDDRDDRRGYDDRRGQGNGDRRDRRDDGWGSDDRRSNGGGRRDSGARDWGQHDDRGGRSASRRDAYADDPWARDTRDSRGDGSFMSRSAESSRRGDQDDEPPF